MKRLFTLLLLLISAGLFAQESFDFRNLNWKMTQQQVKLKEKSLSLLDTSPDVLFYKGDVLGYSTGVLYEFTHNQLSSAFFCFEINNSSENKYVEDYENIKEKLNSKYGQPDTDEIIWREKLYENDPEHIGLAIASQHVVYKCKWYNGGTVISLAMSAKDYKINIVLLYQCYELIKEEIKKNSDKVKEQI